MQMLATIPFDMIRSDKMFGVIGAVIVIGSILFLGLFIFGISIVGDKYCVIEIQNKRNAGMTIKTFSVNRYDKKMTVKSIKLRLDEKLEIGHCVGCSTIDTTDIDFDAIGILTGDKDFEILRGQELLDYLTTKQKVGCATFLIQ